MVDLAAMLAALTAASADALAAMAPATEMAAGFGEGGGREVDAEAVGRGAGFDVEATG